MKISLIVAMASNRVIGVDNRMPWHLSADLKKFKQLTMGSPILMGRKTFESIGRPLPGRRNIIISRNPSYQQPGCDVFNDLQAALDSCRNNDEIFIIGGAKLYKTMLPRADFLYLTEIQQDFAGDTRFPEFDRQQWQEVERQDIDDDESVDFCYSFIKLKKIDAGEDYAFKDVGC
ncbi:type 3 dihydrofolate reductase [Methylomarinum sp. Ch1-1]|uniref:Dihydrofolate reductase n=1 Tax=Methylomarinum roseum TaxID=3067653 RepID=A0AAU7NW34_9GAMM|nr:type 3 dihydrofolate reductase [Methylomarinum sp. Ch1-1]MDP4522739.1 type 3 dihydrofolate reductase [Methylomarinum sp. Ch1-1]